MQFGSTCRAWAALTVSLALAPAAIGQNIPIFIFAGQSNAVGYATDYSELTLAQQQPQNKVLWAGQQDAPVAWGTLSGPTEVNTPHPPVVDFPNDFFPLSYPVFSGQGMGPEFSAPLTISNAMGGSAVGAVKWAINASGLRVDASQDWAPASGEIYTDMVNRVTGSLSALPTQQPGKTGTVAGFFWMQGESDATDEDRADLYQHNLVNLINTVRTQFGNPNLPFVIGQVTNDLNHGDYIDTISRAQANVARLIPNTILVPTDDLQHASSGIPADTLHLSTQGTHDLGVRMGQAYMALQNPLPTGPASMNLAANGSFEDYAVSRFAGFPGNHPGSGQPYPSDPMPGWTTANAGGHTLVRQDAFGSGTAPASHGQQFLSLENRFFGSGDGGAQQSIQTASGQQYTVFYDYSAIAFGANETVSFTADLGGAGTQTVNINTTGFSQLQMTPWTTGMFTGFFGSTGGRNVRFQDTSTLNEAFFGPAIDNVRVVEGPIWKEAGNGNWTTDANWVGGNDPTGSGVNANFLWLNTGAASINLTNDRTVRSLRFDSANSYTIATSNSSQITLDPSTSGTNVTMLVGSGNHTINVQVNLEESLDVDVATSSTLTINGLINQVNGTDRTLRKFGAGSLVITNGTNDFEGPTQVVQGTLKLSHASDTNNIQNSSGIVIYRGATLDVTGQGAGGGITLASGQDISGGGTILGGLTATNSGHNIAPGNSAGIMTFAGTGNITLDSDATITMEVGGTGATQGTAGVNYDQIVVDGSGKTLNIGGARLELVALPGIKLNQPYTLVTAVNGAAINFTTLFRNLANTAFLAESAVHNQAGMHYTINYESSFVAVTFMTPEPSSLGTLVLGSLGLLRRRRK